MMPMGRKKKNGLLLKNDDAKMNEKEQTMTQLRRKTALLEEISACLE